jgi:hypothetical protein
MIEEPCSQKHTKLILTCRWWCTCQQKAHQASTCQQQQSPSAPASPAHHNSTASPQQTPKAQLLLLPLLLLQVHLLWPLPLLHLRHLLLLHRWH